MDNLRRRKRLFEGSNLKNLNFLEIGPLDRPIVTREMVIVSYVDHLDTSGLRKKYAADPVVNAAEIVGIDFVWEGSLIEAVVNQASFDGVVASHLIEHVPDLVTFLQEVDLLTTDSGELFLVIPDKNYTFDYLRHLSTITEVLANYIDKVKRPTSIQILDDFLNSSDWKIEDGWSKKRNKRVPKLSHGIDKVMNIATTVLKNQEYFDVHTWVFSPESFIGLIDKLRELELINWKIKKIIPTSKLEFEFYCVLEKVN